MKKILLILLLIPNIINAKETFDSFGNKKNDDAGWLLLAPLDKLAKEKNEFCDKIKQPLTFPCGIG